MTILVAYTYSRLDVVSCIVRPGYDAGLGRTKVETFVLAEL